MSILPLNEADLNGPPSLALCDRLQDALSAAQQKIAELEAERDALKLEVQSQAQEMRCHRSSLHEAYQYITGATGEPGNWNGARPIKESVDNLREKVAEYAHAVLGQREEIGYLLETLTAERQRRESAETAAKPFAFGDPVLEQILFDGLPDDAPGTITVKRGDFRKLRDHFTRYPTASDSEGANNDKS